MAAESLSSPRGRKVIVIISDGTDTTSQVQLRDCLKLAQNSEAVVYALVVQLIKSEPRRNLAGEHAMIFLTGENGRHILQDLFIRIPSDELRTQYYWGYYPKQKGEKGEFRKIEIRVSNPTYKVRVREGYYAPLK